MERDHPLALELASLRGQLSRYQHASHQSGIQLQGSRLEYTLQQEKIKALESENTRLHAEIETLRANPPVATPSQESLALKQLTLAHRKLSALLDSTEEDLKAKTTDLINCQAYLARATDLADENADGETQAHAVIENLEEELTHEKGLRRKAEVDRDLCNAIIDQYQKQHSTFDLVYPQSNKAVTANGDATHTPTPKADLDSIPTVPIEGLFAGRPGLRRLLDDFAAETSTMKAELDRTQFAATEATRKLSVERKAADSERVLRAEAVTELEKKKRDDRAAAGVVERYMLFSQTSSLALHTSLQNLRARHTATLTTLNAQITELQRRLGEEQVRGQALLRSLGQLGEEVGRESAGRRREIGLRLAALGREERILETLRRWEEKARGALRRTAGPSAIEHGGSSSQQPITDPSATPLVQLLTDASALLSAVDPDEELSSSAAKILLAEDLASGLMEELRVETEVRLALEKERRELLGDCSMKAPKESSEHKPNDPVPLDGPELVDLSVEDDQPARTNSAAIAEKDADAPREGAGKTSSTSPASGLVTLPEPVASDTPLLHSLKTISSLHLPIQHSYHTLHLSLLSLQSTLSDPDPDPPISNQSILLSAVERLLDISEDARVELEIHLDDEIRVAGGFVALLEIGGPGSEKAEEEAVAFVEGRRGRTKTAEVFRRRLEDLEYDAAALKSAVHQPSLPTSPNPSTHFPHTSSSLSPMPSPSLQPTYINPLASLNLRNAMPHFTPPISGHASPQSSAFTSPFRRPSLANLGRLFVSDGSSHSASGSSKQHDTKPGGYQVGQMYRQARGSASALGLRGMAERSESEEFQTNEDGEEAEESDGDEVE